MYGFVFVLVEFLFDEAEVHGFFDDLGVVEETEGFPVYWLSEWFCRGGWSWGVMYEGAEMKERR